MKDNKLRSKDFFDVKQNPLITFRSTKIVQTGPTTFNVTGTFSIRGVSQPETLILSISGKGTGSGTISGTMAFDRKDYGMNSGIPFIKVADRVEVNIDLKATQVSGPGWHTSNSQVRRRESGAALRPCCHKKRQHCSRKKATKDSALIRASVIA